MGQCLSSITSSYNRSKLISKDDKVVLFNCATGLKYPLPEVSNIIDKNNEIDYKAFI